MQMKQEFPTRISMSMMQIELFVCFFQLCFFFLLKKTDRFDRRSAFDSTQFVTSDESQMEMYSELRQDARACKHEKNFSFGCLESLMRWFEIVVRFDGQKREQ